MLQEENRLKRQEIERFEKLKNSFDRTEAEVMIVKELNTEFQVTASASESKKGSSSHPLALQQLTRRFGTT